MIEAFTIFMMITAVLVFALRKYKKSIFFYQIQTAFLIAIFLSIYTNNDIKELLSWSIIAFFTKFIFVPTLLYFLIKKLNCINETTPIGGFFVSPLIAVSFSFAFAVALYSIFKNFALINQMLPLIACGFLFSMGICGFILRTSFIKQILAYCLIENGIHLCLALMAYNAHEIVEIGILTDAIFAVIIMSILAIRFNKSFETLDVTNASQLKG